jgi:1,4-alpha-glucan branching enzyme
MSHAELAAELTRISEARHHDPFSVLGRHPDGDQVVVRVFNPHATEVFIAEGGLPMERLPGSHFFQWRGQGDRLPERYRLIWRDEAHYEHIAHDPYTYAPQLQDFDLHLFGEGRHRHAYRCFGAHPRSHDEVVHGKGSMLNRMPGDEWQRHANLRALYTYQFTHPGKKLLFMGTEFGQGLEWNSAGVLDWYVLQYAQHQGMQRLVRDLNHLYTASPALHRHEFDWQGFEWIDCHDSQQSVLSFLRKGNAGEVTVVVLNLTPVPRHGYRIGVPLAGRYREVLNSDSEFYGGSNMGNGSCDLQGEERPWMGRPYSLALTLPPLAGIVIAWQG